ncbi:MAG: PD-(D/E)XK nuclease family protein [Spirochaetales bacterium]|nr:PD-(D/E)XK nuclease family protein [Spirochaetales bacterium]
MKDLEVYLLKLINESDSMAVFPSEVALQFWQRQLIKNKDLKAIALDRFISWDRFKSMCLGYPEKLKRVNQVVRFLFLIHLLDENKNKAVFKSIIPEVFRESSLLFYKSFLPYLPMLNRLDEINVQDTIEGWLTKKSDLEYMFMRYEQFLKAKGLFEPNFIKSELNTSKQNFKIIFPELIDDFDRFEPLLKASKDIDFYSCEKMLFSDKAEFTVYANLEDEYDAVLIKIGLLLDQGIDPWDIIISACGDSDSLVELYARAKRYDVPLFLHQGITVSRFQCVKLFSQLQNVYSSQFSYDSLEELFQNRSLPWKNEFLNNQLLKFGRESKCYIQEKNQDNMWDTAFRKAEIQKKNLGYLIEFFGVFSKLLKAIVNSKSFAELKDKLMLWVQRFLDTTAWNDQALRTFQFSVKALDELQDACDELNLPLRGNPLSLWQKYLEDKIYVERPDKLAVPVYSYRVSAGIIPAFHFIIQTSQKRLQIVEKKYPYLNSHEEKNLSNYQNDMSADFLKIYSHSGRNVFFSFSESDYNGTNLIPAKLMEKPGQSKNENDITASENLFVQENLAWKEKGRIKRLHSLQADSIERYKLTLELKSEYNESSGVFSPELTAQLIETVRDKEGWLRLSHSQLENFLNCPIQFFWSYFFGLSEQERDTQFFSPMEEGNLAHFLFHVFYQEVKARNVTKLSDLGMDEVEAIINKILEYDLCSYQDKFPIPPRIVWNFYHKNLKTQAQQFIENEMAVLGHASIIDTELRLEERLESDKIKIIGKIDRLSQVPEGLVLIDYKRKVGVKKNLFDENVNSYQLPFYLRLLRAKYNKGISKAGYYDFTKGKYSFVLDSEKDGFEQTDQSVNRLLADLEEKLGLLIHAIKSGRLLVQDYGNQNCEYCNYRGLCRRKFVLR